MNNRLQVNQKMKATLHNAVQEAEALKDILIEHVVGPSATFPTDCAENNNELAKRTARINSTVAKIQRNLDEYKVSFILDGLWHKDRRGEMEFKYRPHFEFHYQDTKLVFFDAPFFSRYSINTLAGAPLVEFAPCMDVATHLDMETLEFNRRAIRLITRQVINSLSLEDRYHVERESAGELVQTLENMKHVLKAKRKNPEKDRRRSPNELIY